MEECYNCGFNDEDYGCTCPHSDKWYACPIENKKPENIQKLQEYAEWLPQYDLPSVTPQQRAGQWIPLEYEALWNRLYNWLNDRRFSIAPDETVTDNERKIRSIQVDLLDEIMGWMVDQVPKADGGDE